MKKNIWLILSILFLIITLDEVSLYFYNQANIKNNNFIILNEGRHEFLNGLIVPFNKTLLIKPGAELIMGPKSSLKIEGKIIAKGNSEKPIVFSGDDNYWRGIKIIGQDEAPDIKWYKKILMEKNFERSNFISSVKNKNIFHYCIFKNLATNQKKDVNNRKKAVIEANNTALWVSHSRFEDIIHMGIVQTEEALILADYNEVTARLVMKVFHLIDSVEILHHNKIIPKRYEYQTWPDGIFGNSGVGIVAYNEFEGLADDAIDFEESLAFIINNKITETYDDGVDLDDKSIVFMSDNRISKAREHTLLVSRNSKVFSISDQINNTKDALVLRNGGTVFAKDLNINNVENGIFLYHRIPLILTIKDFEKIKIKIKQITKEEIDHWGIFNAEENKSASDGVALLDNFYYKNDEFMVLDKAVNKNLNNFESMKDLFRLIDVTKLEDISGQNKEKIKHLSSHENYLYLIDSQINADKALNIFSLYYLEIHNSFLNNEKINFQISKETINDHDKITSNSFLETENKIEYVKKLIKKL